MFKLFSTCIFIFLINNCFAKILELDSTIEFEAYKNCNIKVIYFSDESIYTTIKGCYFFVNIESRFIPQKNVSEYVQLKDGKGNIMKPYFVEFSNTMDSEDSSVQRFSAIVYFIFQDSNKRSTYVNILTNGITEVKNLTNYSFAVKNSIEFKILEFKKKVILCNYLFSIKKGDEKQYQEIITDPLYNNKNMEHFYLLDELELNYRLSLNKTNDEDYEMLLKIYESMYSKGKRDIDFLKIYCATLENVTNKYSEFKNIDFVQYYSEKLFKVSNGIPALSNFELASIFFKYYFIYENTMDSEVDEKFSNLIEEIEKLKSRYEINANYKYRFYLLLGNMNYVIENKASAKSYYEKIITSTDASQIIKDKAIKNRKLVDSNN